MPCLIRLMQKEMLEIDCFHLLTLEFNPVHHFNTLLFCHTLYTLL